MSTVEPRQAQVAFPIPQTDKKSVEDFAKQYTYGGIHILQTDQSIDFTLQFSNIALRSFAEQILPQMFNQFAAQMRQVQSGISASNTSKTLEPKSLIVEG